MGTILRFTVGDGLFITVGKTERQVPPSRRKSRKDMEKLEYNNLVASKIRLTLEK